MATQKKAGQQQIPAQWTTRQCYWQRRMRAPRALRLLWLRHAWYLHVLLQLDLNHVVLFEVPDPLFAQLLLIVLDLLEAVHEILQLKAGEDEGKSGPVPIPVQSVRGLTSVAQGTSASVRTPEGSVGAQKPLCPRLRIAQWVPYSGNSKRNAPGGS